MKFATALRSYTAKRLEEIEKADILVGIPSYNNEKTIAHVIQMVSHGLHKHFKNNRSVIMVADGGSTDDTREVAKEFEIKPWQEKIVSIYRGKPGKGSALRSIFEAATRLQVKACAVVDSDLRSITSDWVLYLISPVLYKGYQFVAPIYTRYKYDATITNNIVYNLTRALYGKRIRQPIGGDFAFSPDMAKFYIEDDVWETDVAYYGVDIWMTTSAITQGKKICQANLGFKIHDVKDPSYDLGPMFRQVIWTLFSLMERYETFWKNVKDSEEVETFGTISTQEPDPINIDLERLVNRFKMGFNQFGVLWKEIFSSECYKEIELSAKLSVQDFWISVDEWVMILYELAATFHAWPINRRRLIDLSTPLYYARVAAFVNQTKDMDSLEAEKIVEQQALIFEYHKDYLIELWDKSKGKAKALSEKLYM